MVRREISIPIDCVYRGGYFEGVVSLQMTSDIWIRPLDVWEINSEVLEFFASECPLEEIVDWLASFLEEFLETQEGSSSFGEVLLEGDLLRSEDQRSIFVSYTKSIFPAREE